jgi:hypothetical protein
MMAQIATYESTVKPVPNERFVAMRVDNFQILGSEWDFDKVFALVEGLAADHPEWTMIIVKALHLQCGKQSA